MPEIVSKDIYYRMERPNISYNTNEQPKANPTMQKQSPITPVKDKHNDNFHDIPYSPILPIEDQVTVGRYRLIKTIGKGNFAKVKLAKHILTGKEVAIKIIEKSKLNSSGLQKLMREVRIMKLLDHPNIVKLFEVIDHENTLYLIMEYCSGGELFDYLVAHGRLKEKEARIKFRQILSAVQYCHQKHVIHRDLKAENLLLDENLNIKIADFGFSNEFQPGFKLETFCGSPPYAAPELFQGRKYEGPEVDIWSLGVILYTLVSGSLPFDGQSLKELREKVLKGKYRIPFYMSTDCEMLLKKMLVLNPQKRATMEVVFHERWVNIGYEDDEMKPFIESPPPSEDQKRIELMIHMGFDRNEIKDSLHNNTYDDVMATYYLLDDRKVNSPTFSKNIKENIFFSNNSSPLNSPLSDDRNNAGDKKFFNKEKNDTNLYSNDNSMKSPVLDSGVSSPEYNDYRKNKESVMERKNIDNCAKNTQKIDEFQTPITHNRPKLARDLTIGRKPNSSFNEASESFKNNVMSPLAREDNNRPMSHAPRIQQRSKTTDNSTKYPIPYTDKLALAKDVTSVDKPENVFSLNRNQTLFSRLSMRLKNKLTFNNNTNNTSMNATLKNRLPNETTESELKQSPKPRSLRFTWNMKTTSDKDPDIILDEVFKALTKLKIQYRIIEKFLIICSKINPQTNCFIQWEVEICKLPRLSLNGVRFRRISGDSLLYKELISLLSSELIL